MNIIIKNITNKDGRLKIKKLINILQGGRLFKDTYRFDINERKCYFEIDRFYLEKPIRESKLLFIFPQYLCGAIRSAIEISPVLNVGESKDGYEDLEISFSGNNILEIGTFKQTFALTISENTILKIYDISTETKTPPYGYFFRGDLPKLNDEIKELSS